MPVDPIQLLDERFRDAIAAAFGESLRETDPLIRPSQNPKFGDFQSNVAMGLAKAVGKNPREVAEKIISHLHLDEFCEQPKKAGPGFINLRLRPEALAGFLAELDAPGLGVQPLPQPGPTVVIDLVGVNIAKQMHVGHLRSSIIGDTLCRVLSRLGYNVIPQNHLGDWGLQIAMVLTALRATGTNLDALNLDELERAYRRANLACTADTRALETARRIGAGPHRIAEWEAQITGAEEALAAAKATLVRLQSGDPALVADWEKIIAVTLNACYEIYDLLDLTVTAEHNRGESFYRDRLTAVVDDFLASGIAEVSEGAVIVRTPGDETPLLIRKSDGGYLYATTDLAAVRYRVQELDAARAIYVVDARQRDHFAKVFKAAHMIGWDLRANGRRTEFEHAAFGSVCGTDGKPLKTRSGENVRLLDLLQEAIRRAGAIVAEKNPELSGAEQQAVARAVGIGAVKYADLSTHLVRDYIFEWDRMLSFEGNTGAYLQNQYVRIRSIARKAPPEVNLDAPFAVEAPEEKALALVLLRYPAVVASVGATLEPHRLCQYLYDLAGSFSVFYTNCPVLKADTAAQRDARLRLGTLTARILADGLSLLGIRTLERM